MACKIVKRDFDPLALTSWDAEAVRDVTEVGLDGFRRLASEDGWVLARIIERLNVDMDSAGMFSVLEAISESMRFYRLWRACERMKAIPFMIKASFRTRPGPVVIVYHEPGLGGYIRDKCKDTGVRRRLVPDMNYVGKFNEWLAGDVEIVIVKDSVLGLLDVSSARYVYFVDYPWNVGAVLRSVSLFEKKSSCYFLLPKVSENTDVERVIVGKLVDCLKKTKKKNGQDAQRTN